MDASYFGMKISVLVAGFFGAVVSLSFVRDLTPAQMLVSVFTGAIAANYLTPLFYAGTEYYLHLTPNAETDGAVAFIVGISAMNIIPAVLNISARFKRSPGSFLNQKGAGDDSANP